LGQPSIPCFSQYCLDNTERLSATHLCGIILAFARLNFQPSIGQEFFSM
ncbi:Protein TBRG4, partial [Acanthisitta chloris]